VLGGKETGLKITRRKLESACGGFDREDVVISLIVCAPLLRAEQT
jgi:hypothetical protein